MRAIKGALGGTVNDLVLATLAGGLGRYLRSRKFSTAKVELRAMCPVSMRPTDQRGQLGNQVSALTAPLFVGIEDPVERFTRRARRDGSAQGGARRGVAARLHPLRRLGATGDAGVRRVVLGAAAALQHGVDQRARPADPALPRRPPPARVPAARHRLEQPRVVRVDPQLRAAHDLRPAGRRQADPRRRAARRLAARVVRRAARGRRRGARGGGRAAGPRRALVAPRAAGAPAVQPGSRRTDRADGAQVA